MNQLFKEFAGLPKYSGAWVTSLVFRLAAVAILLAGTSVAYSAGYKVNDLGGVDTDGKGINDAGTVVGSSRMPTGDIRATMWKDGRLFDLGSVDGTSSQAFAINRNDVVVGASIIKPSIIYEMATRWVDETPQRMRTLGGNWGQGRAINNRGVRAGWSKTESGANHAAIWDTTGVHDLGTIAGGYNSYAFGLNRSGEAVGVADAETGKDRPVYWGADRRIKVLDLLGGTGGDAFAINDGGTIVGSSYLAGDSIYHAAKWNGSVVSDLGGLGGADRSSAAYAINNRGIVVGTSQDINRFWRATVWKESGMVDLNNYLDSNLKAAGWMLEFATAINSAGHIVVNGSNSRQGIARRAFIAIPLQD